MLPAPDPLRGSPRGFPGIVRQVPSFIKNKIAVLLWTQKNREGNSLTVLRVIILMKIKLQAEHLLHP